jgi:hypothetical protein
LLLDRRSQGDRGVTHWRLGNKGSLASVQEGFVVTQRTSSKQGDALPEIPIVIVVDDDPEVREALSSLFRWRCQTNGGFSTDDVTRRLQSPF